MSTFIITDSTSNDVLFPAACRTGAVPRDYGVQPVGSDGLKPPSGIKLIPESEWIPRIQERERLGIGLSAIRKQKQLSSKDQNGQGYCHTADTEVLTNRGWVSWPDYNWSDPLGTVNPITGRMEFQTPFEKHIYDYKGEMIHSTNRCLDFGVTPDHQMYVRKWDESKRKLSDRYSFVRAADLGWYAGFMSAPSGFVGTELVEVEIPGDRSYDGDDLMMLLGLLVSDGYAGGTENTKNWVSFASFRDTTREAISALAARIGFHECPGRPGVWIRYNAGALAEWLRVNMYIDGKTGAKTKRVPEIVKVASARQIKHFLHWFDDRSRDGSQYYSTSKRLIDDLQELFLRIGKRSSIGTASPKDVPFAGNANGVIRSSGGYVLTVRAVDRLCIDRKKHIEQDHYNGPVYCAAVPNHTLITRRNGSVLISSNCWTYSVTRAMEYLLLKANQPFELLSAHSVACKIKGFRDEGGWCGLSAQFIAENGIVPESLWPAKSMSRANDTGENWNAAKAYRMVEGWYDVNRQVWDQDLTWQAVVSLLLQNVPVPADFMWWGHSVCLFDVTVKDGEVCPILDNSWTSAWGDNGTAILQGTRKVPDGAVAPLVSAAA